MENLGHIAKLIVAILTIVSMGIAILEKIKKVKKEDKVDSENNNANVPEIFQVNTSGRNFGDLPLIIIFSVIFSLLAIDAIIPVTDLAVLDTKYFLYAAAITGIIVTLALVSWHYMAHALTLYFLSIGTLLILTFSSVVYLSGTEKFSNETGSNLIIESIILFIITTTFFLYHQNSNILNVFNKENLKKTTWLYTLPIVLSIITQGFLFYKIVLNDKEAPKQLNDESKKILSKLETPKDKTKAYSIFSEINLKDFYYKEYKKILTEYDELSRIDYTPIERFNNQNRQPTNDPYGYGNNDPYGYGNDPDPYDYSPYGNSRNNPYNYTTTYDFNYYKVLYEILNNYENSKNPTQQFSYLKDRLNWIHPVGDQNEIGVPVNLPGLNTLDRFKNITDKRIAYLLVENPEVTERFARVFSYPSSVREELNSKNEKKTIEGEIVDFFDGNLQLQSSLQFSPPTLEDEDEEYEKVLMNQLALPQSEEIFITYKQYLKLAKNLALQGNPKLGDFFQAFENLKPNSQDAFIHYIIEDAEKEELIRAISIVHDISFQEVTSYIKSPYPYSVLAMELNRESGALSSSNSSFDEETISFLQEMTNSIKEKTKEGQRELGTLKKLMSTTGSEVDIVHLFDSSLFNLIYDLERDIPAKDQEVFFGVIANPIKFIYSSPDFEVLKQDELVPAFTNLKEEDKEILLHNMASSLFRFEGEHALNPFKALIFNAGKISPFFGIFCAIIMLAPFIILAIYLGNYFFKVLTKRRRLSKSIENEKKIVNNYFSNEIVSLVGRKQEINRITSLTTKNRSTIALTARRGAGKSRLLREIFANSQNHGVGVWIDCPSKYEQKDFVLSIFEKITITIQEEISKFMGVDTIAIEKIKKERFRETLLIYSLFTIGALFLIHQLYKPGSLLVWAPIFFLFIISVSILIIQYLKLRPIDISNYLGSTKNDRYQTAMLFSKTKEISDYLKNKSFNYDIEKSSKPAQRLRNTFLVIIGIFIILQFIGFIIIVLSKGVGGILFSARTEFLRMIIFSLVWYLIYYFGRPKPAKDEGTSLFTLIEKYRKYCNEVIYRLRKNALGEQKNKMVICIDELDKITSDQEIKDFIRNMKAVFDIDGVSYYLSISEDALKSFTLGSIKGKNEFDSSFDHVFQLKPLSIMECVQIARDYIDSQFAVELSPKILKLISFLSFGIPRDIIRKCESLNSSDLLTSENMEAILNAEKVEKLNIAYQSGLISFDTLNMLADDPHMALDHIKKIIFDKTAANENSLSLYYYVYILLIIETSPQLIYNEENEKELNHLYNIGYSIPTSNPIDIKSRLKTFKNVPVKSL